MLYFVLILYYHRERSDPLMKRIAIVTDSNSGISQAEAQRLGISVLPMPFTIDGELYFEDLTISQEEFYQRLEAGAAISTSQPAPGDVTDLWDKLLQSYDQVVHIPMSSGLSGSCQSARTLALEYGGRVEVVDNQRISVTLWQAVMDAMVLRGQGLDAREIREELEARRAQSSIYICVETLKYLRKGGRITPAAAALGTVLNVKPVLQIQGGKLDAYAKVRGKKAARQTMIDAIRKDMEARFPKEWADGSLQLEAAYSGNPEEAKDWKKELRKAFGTKRVDMASLPLSVACHIGRGALAVACSVAVG